MTLREWVYSNKINVKVMARQLSISVNYLYQIIANRNFPSWAIAKDIENYTDKAVSANSMRSSNTPVCPTCGKRQRVSK